MEPLGEFLKEQREKLKVTIDQISKETNIPTKYLEALENEEYSIFPGEAYLKGFLRTYAKALNLDPEEMVKRYEKIKIAESPIPMEKLIPKPNSFIKKRVLIFGVSLFFVLLIIFFSFLIVKNGSSIINKSITLAKEKKEKTLKTNLIKSIEISALGEEKTINVKENSVINIKLFEKDFIYKIKQISPYVIVVDNKEVEHILFQDKLKEFDLDDDKKNDFSILLNYWDKENANLTLKLYKAEKEEVVLAPNITKIDSIHKSENPSEISLVIKVNANTFFRYKIDENNPVEKFYSTNNSIELKAKEVITLWLSNAVAVDLFFKNINKGYIAGEAGEVTVKTFQWEKKSENEYEFLAKTIN